MKTNTKMKDGKLIPNTELDSETGWDDLKAQHADKAGWDELEREIAARAEAVKKAKKHPPA